MKFRTVSADGHSTMKIHSASDRHAAEVYAGACKFKVDCKRIVTIDGKKYVVIAKIYYSVWEEGEGN